MKYSLLKKDVIDGYLKYSKKERQYRDQNFWLLITGFLLLISLTLLTSLPWTVFHYTSFFMTASSFFVSVITVIKNRGFITPRKVGEVKTEFFTDLDIAIDEKMKDEEISLLVTRIIDRNEELH